MNTNAKNLTKTVSRAISRSKPLQNKNHRFVEELVHQTGAVPVENHPNLAKAVRKLPAKLDSQDVALKIARVVRKDKPVQYRVFDGIEVAEGLKVGLQLSGAKAQINFFDVKTFKAARQLRETMVARGKATKRYEAMNEHRLFKSKKADLTPTWSVKLPWALIEKLLSAHLGKDKHASSQEVFSHFKAGIKAYVALLPQHGSVTKNAVLSALCIVLLQRAHEKLDETLFNEDLVKALLADNVPAYSALFGQTVVRLWEELSMYLETLPLPTGGYGQRQSYTNALPVFNRLLQLANQASVDAQMVVAKHADKLLKLLKAA